MHRILLFCLFLPLVSACTSAVGADTLHNVKIIDQKQADRCRFVGDVHGTSPFYGVFAASALAGARDAALKQAEAMGGNAVVWQKTDTGYGGTAIHGNVYICPAAKG